MKTLNSLFIEKNYCKTEQKKYICINVFYYENNLTYPAYVSDQKFKDYMDLLMITDENKSHYVCIKDFNIFMCNKTKNKNKKNLFKYCLQYFSCERFLIERKEICLEINGKQTIKLVVLYSGKNAVNKFIEAILEEMNCCKKNKN